MCRSSDVDAELCVFSLRLAQAACHSRKPITHIIYETQPSFCGGLSSNFTEYVWRAVQAAHMKDQGHQWMKIVTISATIEFKALKPCLSP